jgi:O-antigen ligase
MKTSNKKIFILCIAAIILGFLSAYANVTIIVAAFLAVMFGVFVISDYQRLTYIVALYVFIDYIIRNYVSSALLSGLWDELLLVLAAALWLYKLARYRSNEPYKATPLDFPLLMFFGVGLFLLVVNSPDFAISLEGLRAVIQYMFWYFAVFQLLDSRKTADNVYRILVYSGTLLALHGILQFIMKVPNPPSWTDAAEKNVTRVFSIIGSPNVLGSLMILLIPMAAGLFFSEAKIIKKLIFLCMTGAMCLCLLFTFSRGAWLGMAVAAFVYFIYKDKRLLIPFAVAALVVIIFVPSISGRITYMLSNDYIASSLKGGRLGRLVIGLGTLKDNLWLGVGLGHFGGAVAMNNIPGSFYMDNYYLKTAIEMGLIGLAAFMALIICVLLQGIKTLGYLRKDPETKPQRELVLGAFAGMCGVLFHNIFENIFEVPMMVTYFWILAAYIIFTGRMNPESEKRHSRE